MIIRVEKDGKIRYIDVPEDDDHKARTIAFKYVYCDSAQRQRIEAWQVTEVVNPEPMSKDLATHIGWH